MSAETRPSYTVMARRLGVHRTTARRRMLAAADVEVALPSIDVADALLDERRELTGLPRLTSCLDYY